MDSSKDISHYQAFIGNTKAPVFYQPWYLDVTCADGEWSWVELREDNQIIAVWPYFLKSIFGLKYITLPPLTSILGPWCPRPPEMKKDASWYTFEKKMLQSLFKQLPKRLLMTIQMSPAKQNWLPLYYLGCQQTTRYTYRCNLALTAEVLWSNLTDSQRNTIRRAKENYQIKYEIDFKAIWRFIQLTYQRQNIAIPFSKSILHNLLRAAADKNCLTQCVTIRNGEVKGVAIVINDLETSYLLITGKEEQDSTGAVSLAIWDTILRARQEGGKIYDFEGSMIAGVESFFRSFGGILTPYHRISFTRGKASEMFFRLMNRI